jgi:hypothetical protein
MVNGNVLKTPLALSLSKPALSLSKGGEREYDFPFMVRQAHHERSVKLTTNGQ